MSETWFHQGALVTPPIAIGRASVQPPIEPTPAESVIRELDLAPSLLNLALAVDAAEPVKPLVPPVAEKSKPVPAKPVLESSDPGPDSGSAETTVVNSKKK
jgi:hypothetical protein